MAANLDREIQKLLKGYEKGIYTRLEAISRLSCLAYSQKFFDYLPSLPEPIIAELRQIALRAPSHPEDFFFIRSSCGLSPGPGPEHEAILENERIRAYWSARKLREFFFPGLEIPAFQPVTPIGTVEESARLGDSVVLFGNFQSWLIRKHPLHCITPDGHRIPVTVVCEGHIKYKCEDSPDSIVREYGRPSLTLGGEVASPDQVPAGSTVWVDRTEKAAIPEIG